MKCLGRAHRDLERRGVKVLAISGDPTESHARFAKALGLRFPLLSDGDLEVAKTYGVFAQTPSGGFATRSVFLIDREGELRYVDRDYRVSRKLTGTALGDAIEALDARAGDPLDALADLPEPERSGKRVLGRLVLAILAEDAAAIEKLLHPDFGARPGARPEEIAKAREAYVESWTKTFADEELTQGRFEDVLDLTTVQVLERDAASATALRAYGSAVRALGRSRWTCGRKVTSGASPR
jgi:hypothetical protein